MPEEARHIDPDKLSAANKDLIDRIEREGAELVYDATLDTLFIEFGGPKEALSEHVVDNIMLRIEPETLEIVGCEILDFFSDFVPNHRLFREMISDLGLQEGKDSTVTLMEPQYKALRDMIEAAIPHLAQAI
jgi:hypothetical protein